MRRRRDHPLKRLALDAPALVVAGVPRVWVQLPSHVDDVDVTERARARRLVVGARRPYSVNEPPGPRLRLSFSAADDAQVSAGVRLLAEVVTGAPPQD